MSTSEDSRRTAIQRLGRIGIWSGELRFAPPADGEAAAAELEELGYATAWIPGGIDGAVLGDVDRLLSATRRLTVATGILNIWKIEPAEVGAWWAGQAPERQARTLLGVGVSHGPAIGEAYKRPLETMQTYLDGLDAAGVPADRLCVAALGPKMLELSRDRTLGAHPYLVPPEHTAIAREALGPNALLAPEQGVVLERDPGKAREMAREALTIYRSLPNYLNSWRRLGFSEEDVTQASDRLIDAIFAWGDLDAIKRRIDAHFDAGADHVCLQVIQGPMSADTGPVRAAWRELAKLL